MGRRASKVLMNWIACICSFELDNVDDEATESFYEMFVEQGIEVSIGRYRGSIKNRGTRV